MSTAMVFNRKIFKSKEKVRLNLPLIPRFPSSAQNERSQNNAKAQAKLDPRFFPVILQDPPKKDDKKFEEPYQEGVLPTSNAITIKLCSYTYYKKLCQKSSINTGPSYQRDIFESCVESYRAWGNQIKCFTVDLQWRYFEQLQLLLIKG